MSDYCGVGLEQNSLVSNEIDVAAKTTTDRGNTNQTWKKFLALLAARGEYSFSSDTF